jgi:putative oxidoreductase
MQPRKIERSGRSFVIRALNTDASKTALFQRLVLASVVLPHGLQKMFGWFGGWGLSGTIAWFESALGVPAPLAWLVIASDFLGAIALALGLFTRLTALGTALTMFGAIALVHAPNGFFMNWSGAQAGEGFEFHLLALALSLPLAVRGAGAWSLDRWLLRTLATRSSTTAGAVVLEPHALGSRTS